MKKISFNFKWRNNEYIFKFIIFFLKIVIFNLNLYDIDHFLNENSPSSRQIAVFRVAL